MRGAFPVCGLLACLLLVHAAAPARAAAAQEPVAEVDLVADLSGISLRQARVIGRLIEAARATEDLYRRQLEPGGFYPADMSREEFEAWADPRAVPQATHPHFAIRRRPDGGLEAVPYHEAWPAETGRIARLLAEAADITDDEALKHYLALRARALIVGDYPRAEAAWQALHHSDIDILIGPLGTGDDARFGLKSAFGAYVLRRDWAWGARLARFTVSLPELQHALPVSAAFKDAVPEVNMKLAVFDLLYHGGYGMPRTSATPDSARDRRVRLERGPRQLQLRNVMQARFDVLVHPAAELLLAAEDQAAVRFEPFFLNIMLRDMAHALGLVHTVDGRDTVAAALGEHAAVIEEAKATILSLWLAERLHERGELPETRPQEHYASFLAGILRAVHLDPDGVAGRARLVAFNHLRDWGAVRRDAPGGRYRVDPARMPEAIEALAAQLLTLQGSGDRAGAAALLEYGGGLRAELAQDLARLDTAALPTAILFRQGEALLGL
ncbi:hypothetical protein [Thioalkalivibrio sp. XN279]|uniref:hypothetical protein n=1 Tax=Thioalkalivibrio sp. XN279 TaxID=2714953 RepID=UPI00140B80B8|nr:hypothetical protein [Thioalkalivibrio sp. XN279]NHA14065.1 hypothetical protein [Thioalkalivibrio sp. XN279]